MDSENTLCDQILDVNAVCGVAQAILTCHQNSHPFQDRVLILDQPVKIGRAVARSRAATGNGIFDCKVLSRNHAIMWYENDKFYIQDTKSSNGTFVNSQRLSQGAEDSPPRELWSGDVLQFGVDVLENQRKVTHGCIVATVKLIQPNGKEAKPSSLSNTYSKEDMYTLQLVLNETQLREERLRSKLVELEGIVNVIQETSRDALNQRFEESRLLSKIETLQKRIKVISKLKAGESEESDMISQLLSEVEKVQGVSREIQERLHRDLIISEDSLTVAKRDASNFLSEIQSLKDVSLLHENKIQELAEKCNGYMTAIENLEVVLKDQKKENMELETRVEGLQAKEEIFQKLLEHPLGKLIYEHFLEVDNERVLDRGGNIDQVVGEWYDHFFTILKDHVNEEHAWKLIKKLLETLFAEMDQSRHDYESLSLKKQALILKIEAEEGKNRGLENVIQDKNCDSNVVLKKELREVEDHLWEALTKRKTFEKWCKKMRLKLDSALNSQDIEKGDNIEKTDLTESETFTVDHLRQFVETLSKENEKGDVNYEKFILPKKFDGQTQTFKIAVDTKETMTDGSESDTKKDTEDEGNCFPVELVGEQPTEIVSLAASSSHSTDTATSCETRDDLAEQADDDKIDSCNAVEEPSFQSFDDACKKLRELTASGNETHEKTLSTWEQMKEIYGICDETFSGDAERLASVRRMLNMVSEDLVILLVHARKREEERKELQERLNESASQIDANALSFADRFLALAAGLIICFVGSILLENLGILS